MNIRKLHEKIETHLRTDKKPPLKKDDECMNEYTQSKKKAPLKQIKDQIKSTPRNTKTKFENNLKKEKRALKEKKPLKKQLNNLFKLDKYQITLILILLISLSMKLILLFDIHSFQQADPGEYMDMAYQLVWSDELHSMDMRSWFFSIFLSIPLYGAKIFGINNGDLLVSLVRLVPIMFGLSSTYLVYIIGKKLKDKYVGLAAAFLLSVNWLFNVWSISPVAGVPCAFFVLLGYYFYIQNTSKFRLLSGLMFGFAFMLRFQGAIFIIPLLIWDLYCKKIKQMLYLSSTFVLGIFLQGLLDFYIYGAFLHSVISFIKINVVTTTFNKLPFTWYLTNSFYWIGLIEIVLLALGTFVILKSKKNILLSLIIIMPFLITSFMGHKEYRYLLQIIPFICLVIALGIEKLIKIVLQYNRHKTMSYLIVISVGFVIFTSNMELISKKNINYNEDYMNGLEYINDIHKNKTINILTMTWAVGGNYYRNENVHLIDGAPNTWENQAYIYDALNKSDYFLMNYNFFKKNRNITTLLKKDYVFEKSFNEILLFKKNINKTESSLFYGIYFDDLEITNRHNINFNNSIEFLGYNLESQDECKQGVTRYIFAKYDRTYDVSYYWKSLKPINESYMVFVHFLNETGDIVFGHDHIPFYEIYGTNEWKTGESIKESYSFRIPDNIKSDKYYVRVGLYNENGRLPVVTKNYDLVNKTPIIQNNISINYNNTLEFLGYDLDKKQVEQENKFKITYYWKLLKETDKDYVIFVHFLGKKGQIGFQNDHEPSVPTSNWSVGQIYKETYVVDVTENLAIGKYYLSLGFYTSDNGRIPIVEYDISKNKTPDHVLSTPTKISNEALGIYDDKIAFLGYNSDKTIVVNGGSFHITYFWKSLNPVDSNYTVFVHVIDENEKIILQQDHDPAHGAYPTTAWNPGETIKEEYDVNIPENMPLGIYHIKIGLYNQKTGSRLLLLNGKNSQIIGNIVVKKPEPILEIIPKSDESKPKALSDDPDIVGIIEVN